MVKVCTKCKEEKQFSQFHKNSSKKDGLMSSCKTCQNVKHKSYYKRNSEKLKTYAKIWRKKNKEREKEYRKQYIEENKERIRLREQKYYQQNIEKIKVRMKKYNSENREKRRDYERKRRKEFPKKRREYRLKRLKEDKNYALLCLLRSRLRSVLQGERKAAATRALLGCTLTKLRRFLQNQFIEGMTWENRGKVWHLDHMLPCSFFDFSSNAQQKRCFHYSNLQPLFASDNIRKSDKNIYRPYMKWEKGEWHIKINGEYMSRSRQVKERIPTQYFYPIKWMISKYNA